MSEEFEVMEICSNCLSPHLKKYQVDPAPNDSSWAPLSTSECDPRNLCDTCREDYNQMGFFERLFY